KNLKDFMFGGGNMPWLAVGISLIATSVSASTFLGNPANSYATDMRFLMRHPTMTLNLLTRLATLLVNATVLRPRKPRHERAEDQPDKA
ncbi:MAG: hypothetical protein AAB211_01870, partial [Pseudomonadota bacterium]